MGIARELAERGANVTIADLQQEKASLAAASLAESHLSAAAVRTAGSIA